MKINMTCIFLALIGTILASCTKDEAILSDSTQTSSTNAAVSHYAVNPPYDEGEPGVDPTIDLRVISKGIDPVGPEFPFNVINTPTSAYKNETCLLDISKLETGKTYSKIQDSKLAIGFFYIYGLPKRVLKLKSGLEGWNSKWGSAENIECENPDVLFMNAFDDGEIIIKLSKPCIEFGFELAPNYMDYDIKFGAAFGEWYYSESEGVTVRTFRSPSGAHLIAMKATKSFDTVVIFAGSTSTFNFAKAGLALANIRYRLAE